MRILILGATGMLGHKLAQVLAPEGRVTAAVRDNGSRWPESIKVEEVATSVDIKETGQLVKLLDRCPDAVLNAVGMVKQIMSDHDPMETIAVNSVFPKVLAGLCAARGIRLIHYSTDCVFTGLKMSVRGPNGYRESDLPDARDLYGASKFLGEPPAPCLTIRTSIIGRELRGKHGLVEWFLAQNGRSVKGFTQALFTGLPTLELARVTATILNRFPTLEGTWNIAAAPIDKYELLSLLKELYGQRTLIAPADDFYCDRRLDGERFSRATGWNAPAWRELISMMHADPFPYPEAGGES
jgi:dTDP-4-dehydrorhamnose reductase